MSRLSIVFLFLLSFGVAQQIAIINSEPSEIRLSIANPVPTIKEVQTEKGRFWRLVDEYALDGYGISTEMGKAELLVIREFIEIPQGAEVNLETRIQKVEFRILPYPVYPLQPPEPKCGPKPPFTYDEKFYQSDEFYPKEYAKITDIVQIRHARIAILEIYPFRYNPAKNQLEIITEAEISLKLSGSDLAKTEEMYQKYATLPFRELLRGLVLNDGSKSWPPSVNDLNLPIHYLIVCPDAWLARLEPFVQWKKEKGYKVRVATLSQTGYSKEEIRQYLLNEYQGPNPQTFVLLVGDVESIPCWNGQGYNGPKTDLPYACYVNFPTQYFPQVYLARFSVRNTQELDSLVQKTIAYEKGHYSGQWMKKAYFIASADPEERWWAETSHVRCMNLIRNYGVICDSLFLYYNSGTPVDTALNDGRAWVIYSGHGNVSRWSEIPYDTSDVKLLQNLNKVPFVQSYSCYCGKYQEGNCFAEAWERVGLRGAICHLAASEESYWGADYELQVDLFRVAFDSGYTWVMGMINKAKHRFFIRYGNPIPQTTRQYFEMYNLFGDPSLQIYWDEPLVLMPTFPSSIPIGYQTITVQTSTNQKCLVCLLSKHDTIHQAQYTTTGSVQFSFSAGFGDTLILTISGHNLKTYQDLIIVESPDVGITKLIIPAQVDLGQVIVPACSVYNYGTTTASYWTKMKIGEFYQDSLYLQNHLPYTFNHLAFRACTFSLRGNFAVVCSTNYPDDLNPENDKITGSIFVGPYGWTQKRSMPTQVAGKYVKDGGALVATSNCLYAFRGNKSNEFYQYLPLANSWIRKESMPFTYKPGTTTLNKKRIGKGASLCWDGNNIIYATKGNGTFEFWAYDILNNQWTFISFVPSPRPLKGGTSMAYLNGKVYLLAGGQKVVDEEPEDNFFAFNPTNSKWDTLTPAPIDNDNKSWKDGSCLVLAESLLYALKGSGRHNYFWVYNANFDNWTELETIPLRHPIVNKNNKVKDGAAMVSNDTVIYAIKGGGSCEFWQYLLETGSWLALETIPRLHKKSVPKTGAAMAYLDGNVWLLKGNNTQEFWSYLPSIKLIRPATTSSAMTEKTISHWFNFEVMPNPLDKKTTIYYTVPTDGNVTIKLYNATGRLIKTLVNEHLAAGNYSLTLSAEKLTKGIYFLKCENEGNSAKVKLIVQ